MIEGGDGGSADPSNRIEERSGHASCVRADADLPPVAILGRSPSRFGTRSSSWPLP